MTNLKRHFHQTFHQTAPKLLHFCMHYISDLAGELDSNERDVIVARLPAKNGSSLGVLESLWYRKSPYFPRATRNLVSEWLLILCMKCTLQGVGKSKRLAGGIVYSVWRRISPRRRRRRRRISPITFPAKSLASCQAVQVSTHLGQELVLNKYKSMVDQ